MCTSAAPRASEQSRERREHPQLLDGSAELERLDSIRNELRMARRGCEPKVVRRERSQLAEEVAHVRLVAGAAAAEHVGVDDDQRGRHPSAFR